MQVKVINALGELQPTLLCEERCLRPEPALAYLDCNPRSCARSDPDGVPDHLRYIIATHAPVRGAISGIRA